MATMKAVVLYLSLHGASAALDFESLRSAVPARLNSSVACSATQLCDGGACCSQYGYCGTTADFCGSGCLSQCDGEIDDDSGVDCSATKMCPGGACCSQYNYCGTTSEFCGAGCLSQCDGTASDDTAASDDGGTTSGTYVGGYLLLNTADGLSKLNALAKSASTLPINRMWISFARPDMVYEAGTASLEGTGLEISTSGDYGFAAMAKAIKTLQAGGVDVFLSLGGWNYNCFPYAYTRYSVGGYGTATPNYWKIDTYGNGDVDNCDESNQFCWTCEPESEGTDLYTSFTIFPEPKGTDSWDAATATIESGAAEQTGGVTPEWHPELAPGATWTDATTGASVRVPGLTAWSEQGRDPYVDFVTLAAELGVAGVDLDYEEMWHADLFKLGDGPWTNPQTTYKYAAIVQDLVNAIAASDKSDMKLSTAAAAVGAWGTDWWGGNLKGVWYFMNLWFPTLFSELTTGGINVMTYDLSSNMDFSECPDSSTCSLSEQVDFYMDTFKSASIPAAVGYEIGTPAYPDVNEDTEHQLPLTTEELATMISATQPGRSGFFWELYKSSGDDQASPTDTAQAVCKVVLGSSEARCSGTIPEPSADDDGLGDDSAAGDDTAPVGDDGSSSGNVCLPDSGCNVCDSCCQSYLGDQDSCDGCVEAECPAVTNVCTADDTCTACDSCCKSYLSDQDSCDGCVSSQC